MTLTERQQFLNDVLITAVEGGINYWASVSEYQWGTLENPLEVASVTVWDNEADIPEDEGPEYARHPITSRNIASALGVIGDKTRTIKYVSDEWRQRIIGASRLNDAGEIDAGDADAIVQVAIFGEVVYG